MQKIIYLLPVIVVTIILQGCAASNSSGSISESSSSISKGSGSGSDSSGSVSNSSESSSSGDDQVALQIMDYTTVYLTTTEFDRPAFAKGISEIAASNGIAGWEDEKVIWVGIGRGLKKANLTAEVFKTYQKSLAESQLARMDGIQLGYNMQ
ncbi:MAG: putative lipoprotein [Methylococcales bacterium]|nr:putative lipoprotein [Methylococcales bacterium]